MKSAQVKDGSVLKIQAFFEEFPWLSNYYNKKYIESILISRVDVDILREKRGSQYEEENDGAIIILEENGDLIGKVGKVIVEKTKKTSAWNFLRWGLRDSYLLYSETVLSAIERFGPKKPVHFIIARNSRDLIIYKSPKGYSVQEWIKYINDLEHKVIRAECEGIDRISA